MSEEYHETKIENTTTLKNHRLRYSSKVTKLVKHD